MVALLREADVTTYGACPLYYIPVTDERGRRSSSDNTKASWNKLMTTLYSQRQSPNHPAAAAQARHPRPSPAASFMLTRSHQLLAAALREIQRLVVDVMSEEYPNGCQRLAKVGLLAPGIKVLGECWCIQTVAQFDNHHAVVLTWRTRTGSSKVDEHERDRIDYVFGLCGVVLPVTAAADADDQLQVGSRLFLCKSKTWRGLGEDDERILWPFGGKEAISSAHTKALHIARESARPPPSSGRTTHPCWWYIRAAPCPRC